MRVLLIEDDPNMAESIELMLKSSDFQVDIADMGEEGLEIGQIYDYDIIILDLMLPDMDGYDVLKQLRAAKVTTPVLILSGLKELDNKVKGLGYGADDYLTKPFEKKELLARMQAIIRRSAGHAASIIYVGPLEINLEEKSIWYKGKRIPLTSKEYAIVELLALRKGSVLAKEVFLSHLYNGMDEPEIKVVDVFICKIRKKLQDATGNGRLVETVWGRGYVMKDDAIDSPKSEAKTG